MRVEEGVLSCADAMEGKIGLTLGFIVEAGVGGFGVDVAVGGRGVEVGGLVVGVGGTTVGNGVGVGSETVIETTFDQLAELLSEVYRPTSKS